MYKVPFKVDLSKKVIAITGAGGIICGEFARALSACGAKVALLDINYEAAKKVADEIGEKAFAVKCNCLDKEDIKAAKAAVNEKFGAVNYLINGAGGNNPKATCEKRGRFFYRKIRDAAEKRKEKTGNGTKERKKRKNFKKNEKS